MGCCMLELAATFLHNPVTLTVGSTELRANPNIQQLIHCVDYHEKNEKLTSILDSLINENSQAQAMVFTQTKRDADLVESHLKRRSYRAVAIHGDKSQAARDYALDSFRARRCRVLVATDVASRGIDVPDLAAVINYTMPDNIESYVHRVGRTGRVGKSGVAHTIFTPLDSSKAKPLIQVLKQTNQNVPQDLAKHLSYNSSGDQGYGGRPRQRGGYGSQRGYGGNRGGFGGSQRYGGSGSRW